MSADIPATPAVAGSFAALGLPAALLRALADVGYETPSPIQEATIPPLLAGGDLVGQAQTGTGKTAAFALPILVRLGCQGEGRQEEIVRPAPSGLPSALVLTPTRELAIQVAEAFQRYAKHLPGFHVLPVYGGQAYGPQLGGLRRGVHVVVGTPGRVIDHLDRGTLRLDALACLVLDEGDEMLRMGFIDDVEKVLEKSPAGRQVALFSATMPPEIRRIAKKHLKDPAEITIRNKTTTAANTRQRYWMVSGVQKLDALTRILEVESFDAMIVFARTKVATEELAERLEARGFAAAALNGDMAQAQRERTIARLKSGDLDIVVATDVAARGLDVDRISHVLNYDIPYDTEAYVHRIGRTGRAGRKGEAILFVTYREQHLLRSIERATRQPIEPMLLPTVAAVNDQRIVRFKQKITEALAATDLALFRDLIEQYEAEHGVSGLDVAAALAKLVQGDAPLLVPEPAKPPPKKGYERAAPAGQGTPGGKEWRKKPHDRAARDERPGHAGRSGRAEHAARPDRHGRPERPERGPRAERDARPLRPGMVRYRLAVGHAHGVKPGNIVGAIANEAGLDNQFIGRVDIRDDHSLIDLPEGMPREVLRHLRKVWVAGQQLQIRAEEAGPEERRPGKGVAPHAPAARQPHRNGVHRKQGTLKAKPASKPKPGFRGSGKVSRPRPGSAPRGKRPGGKPGRDG